jgi:hypothetical protein
MPYAGRNKETTHFLMSNATALFIPKKLSGLLDVNMHALEDCIGYLAGPSVMRYSCAVP